DRVELSHQVIDTFFRLVNEPLVMFDVFITRDKTSMRYQTHYQLKQMWLDPFGNCQAIGGNELIHSGLFQVYHLGFGSS
ncbi:hypothetical protein RK089_01860, partial [Streptococcus pneumoniae]|nr:hypothetical protein [Streptococcus pneumoniae]MDS3119383.1 hypothetical protein [Streptococcus pneumoniae]MDS8104064.1 hypothetical protein [Streptococcus pneumoniae]MDS8192904.1 hypothetical protein [Streptococcus pneumoniae]MDT5447543.1 hypothetical protein [Streptococcus pneumoniae]